MAYQQSLNSSILNSFRPTVRHCFEKSVSSFVSPGGINSCSIIEVKFTDNYSNILKKGGCRSPGACEINHSSRCKPCKRWHVLDKFFVFRCILIEMLFARLLIVAVKSLIVFDREIVCQFTGDIYLAGQKCALSLLFVNRKKKFISSCPFFMITVFKSL